MLSGDRLNSIRAFVQAEISGSFAAAAQDLGLSQSAVGKAVARLESRLSVRLFNRTTRNLSLTEEGRAYYASCLRALGELEAAEIMIADLRASPSGTLRMSLPDLFGRRIVLPTLNRLGCQYPDLRLDVSFDNRFVDLVEDSVDLAVRIGHLQDSAGLIARRLGEQQLQTYASPVYLAAQSSVRSVADLSQHRCITQIRRDAEEPWLFGEDKMVRRTPVRGHHRFTALDAIAEAAAAGMGIAQIPSWLAAPFVETGRLVTILDMIDQPRLPVQLVWLQSRHMMPRVRAIVDGLVEHFLQHPSSCLGSEPIDM